MGDEKLVPEQDRREQLLRAPKAEESDAAPRVEVTRTSEHVKRIDVADTAAVRPGKPADS